MRHRTHRTDANQPQIVKDLRKAGYKVYILGRPFDLLVGLRGRVYLVEIKNKDGKNKLTQAQKYFIEDWGAEYVIIGHTTEDVINGITAVAGFRTRSAC